MQIMNSSREITTNTVCNGVDKDGSKKETLHWRWRKKPLFIKRYCVDIKEIYIMLSTKYEFEIKESSNIKEEKCVILIYLTRSLQNELNKMTWQNIATSMCQRIKMIKWLEQEKVVQEAGSWSYQPFQMKELSNSQISDQYLCLRRQFSQWKNTKLLRKSSTQVVNRHTTDNKFCGNHLMSD